MNDTRWSYKVIHFKPGFLKTSVPNPTIEEELNRLGAQGWELVSAHSALAPVHPIRAILKRRI